MKFTDFEPKQLIGKKVLISGRYHKSIKTITRVTKTAFGFSDSSDLFLIKNGWLKGGGVWNMVSAELISDERAAELSMLWKENKKANANKEELVKSIQFLTNEETFKLYEFFKTIRL